MLSSPRRVSEAIRRLNYDFTHFNVSDFVLAVQHRRGKLITVEYQPLSTDVFGLWIDAPYADYIFVNSTTHPIHQVHTVLHEIGHMRLNHPLYALDHILSPEMLRVLHLETAVGRARYVPKHRVDDTPDEREAEEFVFQVRQKISHANWVRELTVLGSSIETLWPLIQTGA